MSTQATQNTLSLDKDGAIKGVALVLEGGGFRGVYTAGVLDA
ncbi:hypothetical protein [Geofilum rubicundum]|nr:hypothetical protein [Geofilum rubicundum]